jgi:hypothetical protein
VVAVLLAELEALVVTLLEALDETLEVAVLVCVEVCVVVGEVNVHSWRVPSSLRVMAVDIHAAVSSQSP